MNTGKASALRKCREIEKWASIPDLFVLEEVTRKASSEDMMLKQKSERKLELQPIKKWYN